MEKELIAEMMSEQGLDAKAHSKKQMNTNLDSFGKMDEFSGIKEQTKNIMDS